MRDRPHAPHQPSSVTLRITRHQSSPAGRAVGAPVIELQTRSTAFPLFSPARRAREPYLSRFSPAPRWGLPFVPRSRSSRPLCLASDAAPSEGNSAGAAECLRRSRTLAPVRFRLLFAHRSRGSHLQQSRPRLPGHTSFVAQTSLGDGYLATVQAFWANLTPGPRLCIRPNSAPDASQSINKERKLPPKGRARLGRNVL